MLALRCRCKVYKVRSFDYFEASLDFSRGKKYRIAGGSVDGVENMIRRMNTNEERLYS